MPSDVELPQAVYFESREQLLRRNVSSKGCFAGQESALVCHGCCTLRRECVQPQAALVESGAHVRDPSTQAVTFCRQAGRQARHDTGKTCSRASEDQNDHSLMTCTLCNCAIRPPSVTLECKFDLVRFVWSDTMATSHISSHRRLRSQLPLEFRVGALASVKVCQVKVASYV